MEALDVFLSIVDIIFCIVDIGLICYLFFYRFPPEKKNKFKKFTVKKNLTFYKKF